MVSFDRVVLVAVVGNEDGGHHVSAELYQALNDVGLNRLATNGVARSGDCAPRPQAGTGRKASRNCWLRPWLDAQMSSGAWNSRA
jgi:hypothetical protein